MNKIFYIIFLISFLFVGNAFAQDEDCNIYELLDPIPNGAPSLDTPSRPCGFTPVGLPDVYINQCSPCQRKISDDDCLQTPNPTLCELDGFQTQTGGFTEDVEFDPNGDPLGRFFCNGAGTLENNFWIGFTAQTNILEIRVSIGDCSRNLGVQVAIVETNCIDEFNTMEGNVPCVFQGISQGGAQILDANNLVPGNPYYIMVDGFAGDVCDLQIEVLDGFGVPEYDVVPVLAAQLCPDVTDPDAFTAQPGSGAQVFVTTGGIATTDLTFYWLNPSDQVIATTGPVSINGNQVQGALDGSFFTEVGTYSVEIIDNGSCCPLCTSIDLEVAMPPAAAAAIISGVNGQDELNCTNPVVEVIGNPDDGSTPFVEQWQIVVNPSFNGGNPRSTILQSLVSNDGRINELDITQELIEDNLPGEDVGTATIIYGFLNDGNQLCFGDAFVEIPFDFRTPDIDFDNPDDIDCLSNPTVEINASFTDTYGHDATYAWTYQDGTTNGIVSGGDTDIVTVADAGFYTLVVTDNVNGCIDSVQIQVGGMVDAPDLLAIETDTLNCTTTTLSLASMGDAGGSPITYAWTLDNNPITGETDPMIDITMPGTYALSATNDDNGCSSFTSVTIFEDRPMMTIDAIGDSIITCTTTEITFPTALVSDGNGDYTYAWDNGTGTVSTDPTLTESAEGTYTLTVTDTRSGCTATQTATIAVYDSEPAIDALPTDLVLNCTNGEMVSTTASATASDLNGSAVAGLEYEWFDDADMSIGNAADIDFTTEGTYTVVVTNPENGCTSQADITITLDNEAPDAAIAEPSDLTCTATMVTLTGSSMETNVSYQWYDGADDTAPTLGAAADQDVTVAGTYSVVITNLDNGCTTLVTETVVANDTDPVPAIATPEVLTCRNDVTGIELDGSGSSTTSGMITYAWTAPDNTVAGSTEMVNATQTGIYTLLVTDSENGCTMETTVEVMGDFDPPQGLTADDDIITCDDAMTGIMLNGSSTSPNVSYKWIDEGMVEYPGQNPTVMAAGTYTLCVTNEDNGCTATTTAVVTNDANVPTVLWTQTDGGSGNITCNNPFREFTGESNDTDVVLTWYDPNDNPLTGNPIVVDENSLEGTYTIRGLNPNNNCGSESSVQVTFDFTAPNFTLEGGTIFCDPNDSVELSATDNDPTATSTYTWRDDSNMSLGAISNPTVTTPGIYTVTATSNVSGCTSEGTVEVFANNTDPTVTAAMDFDLSCRPGEDTYALGGSATAANGTDALTYEWTLNNTPIADANNPNPTVSEAGTYMLTVTNTVSNCTATETVVVGDITTDPIPVAGVQMVLNCETPMVQLEGDATDPDATYQWTSPTMNVINEEDPMVGESGEWILVVTSANGCTGMTTVMVEEDFDAPENVMITGNSLLTCQDNTVQLSGSTSTMDIRGFEWTLDMGPVFSTEQAPNVGDPGTYTLIVTGDNGCTATETFVVTQDEGLPVVSADPQDVLTCDVTSTMILTSSSAANSTYQWEGPGAFTSSTQDVEATTEGTYMVTITDTDNGCSSVVTTVVDFNRDEPVLDPMGTTVTCEDMTFSISAATTTPNVEYMWEGPAPFTSDSPNPEVTEAGTYMVTVTDPANGCSTIETIEVMEGRDLPENLMVSADVDLLTCNNMESILTASTDTDGVIITFSGDNTNTTVAETITVTEPGLVSVNFFNPANGCETTETYLIEQDITEPMAVPEATEELNCQTIEVALAVTTNETVTYAWDGPAGGLSSATEASPFASEPGTYNVTVTADDNGCTSVVSIQVDQDTNIPVPVAAFTEITCSNPMAQLIGDGSTTGADISYEWTNSAGMVISTDLNTTTDTPGDYTLTVFNSTNLCEIEELITVTSDLLEPTTEAGADVDFPCAVDMVTLSGSGTGQGNLSYEWFNAGNTSVGTGATIDVAQSGVFTLVVTDDDNGCTSMDTMEVIPDEDAPIIDVLQAATITCDNPTVTLDASNTTGVGTLDFEWTFDLNGAPAGTGATIDVSNPGNYTVLVTDQSNGCDDSFTISVDENRVEPSFELTMPTILCDPGFTNVEVLNLSVNNPSYNWEGPAGTGFTSTDPELTNISMAGNYSVTITDLDNGCTTVATTTVSSDENIPQSSIAPSEMLDCDTEQVELQGDAPAGLTYSWTGPGIISGGNTLSPIVGTAGDYTLTVLNSANGCFGETSITVEENTNVITAFGPEFDNVNCFGPNTGSIAAPTTSVTGGTAPYLFSIDGGNSFTTQEDFLGLTAGDYNVVVQDANGCEFDQVITIDPALELALELGENQVIAFGDSLILSPQTNFDIDVIAWNDSTLVGNSPWVKPTNTTTFEVTAFDEDGCVTTDFITIFVEKTRPVYIPSGFSPNGDGINDFFTVYADVDLITRIKSLSVYDRWGEQMYFREEMTPEEALNEINGWNGNYRNTEMNPGVYVYHVLVEFIDGEEIFYEGDITLMR